MKPLCCARLFWLFWLCALTLWATPPKSAVVYYGEDIPYTLLGVHDYIIVQPDHVNTATHGFKVYAPSIYAYVSLGEAEPGQRYFDRIKREWIVGENPAWQSKLLDLSSSAYHDFILDEVLEPLHVKGFRHFFFDTLDSYQMAKTTPQQRQAMQEGLVALVKRIHARYPDAKIVINRGFEVIEALAPMINAVLFESLYRGLAPDAKGYQNVSDQDRAWLLRQVEKIKALGLDVIALDYLEPSHLSEAPEVAKRIAAHGVIPYIGDRDLQVVGYSSKNALKREVLVLFDLAGEDDPMESSAFLYGALPIEYQGYVPVLYDIGGAMPDERFLMRFAGVVFWSDDFALREPGRLYAWVERIKKMGLKMLFIEGLDPQVNADVFSLLGIKTRQSDVQDLLDARYDPALMAFEIEPSPPMSAYEFLPEQATELLSFVQGERKSVSAAITPWGGYALAGAAYVKLAGQTLWVANPFELIKRALALDALIVPDPTTQNGRRLLFAHMDGDGFMNRAEWNSERFSAEVLYEEVFKRYTIPMSLSVIEAEIAPHGLYPDDAPALEKIARDIFALEHVEAATHTYTHPFYWSKVSQGKLDPAYRLPIKEYDFSVDREIRGSLEYINTRLAPKDRPARITFWSGDCQPTPETLAYMYEGGYLQINGGDTTITNDKPWLSLIAPYGIKRGDHYQIFTGQQNENVFTNNWLGPYWGFKKVIQTFERTETPRRFKPIDIYYHTYSGSKEASLNALKSVYEWAIKQETMPIFTSQFIPKVMDFYTLSIADLGSGWLIRGADALKTVRLSGDVSIDMAHSEGVAGVKAHESGRYVHLSPDGSHFIARGEEHGPYLVDANAPLRAMRFEPKRQHLELSGEVPLRLRYRLEKGCTLQSVPEPTRRRSVGDTVELEFERAKEASIDVLCR